MKITLKNGKECNIKIEDAEHISIDSVRGFFKSMDINISDDFAEFYSDFCGGCGFPEICGTEDKSFSIEDSFYIDIYTFDELTESNDDELMKQIDNVFFFASDGGEMAIGYDYVQNRYFWIPYIDIGIEPLEYLGNNSEEFFNFLIEYFAENDI